MSQNKTDDKKELKAANERRMRELLNINNRYLRTKRHLEEFADIMDFDRLEHVSRIQKEREHRMENLKDIIVHGKHKDLDQVKNIKRNLEFTENYLQRNAFRMDKDTLEKTLEKQAHRKEQLGFLD